MTVHDLRCDFCSAALAGPDGISSSSSRGGVRFVYHPGSFEHRDDSGMACASCWAEVSAPMATAGAGLTTCALCGGDLQQGRLVVSTLSNPETAPFWALCRLDGIAFLNRLRTVEPKLDPASFRFPPGTVPGAGG